MVIKKCNENSYAYVVRAPDGHGKARSVNVVDMKFCKRGRSQNESSTESRTDSSPYEIYELPHAEDFAQSNGPDEVPQSYLRWSKTAEGHFNPFNLPESTVKEFVCMDGSIRYNDFSKAVNDLGAIMASSLGTLLQIDVLCNFTVDSRLFKDVW